MEFVQFSALILMPLFFRLDPNVALYAAGSGAILFQIITKPGDFVFFDSLFAFAASIIYGIKNILKTLSISGALCALGAIGFLYALNNSGMTIISAQFLLYNFLLIIAGPAIMIIGLILVPAAVYMISYMIIVKIGGGAFQISQSKVLFIHDYELVRNTLPPGAINCPLSKPQAFQIPRLISTWEMKII
ncbi:MAG: hypothetical protein GY874_08615 [Desulfobacteraceae bacterium]|nr:hypothetical protein [Desulfobacteraceae bacterium]